jgi:uncharacterized protein (TIGR00295 family)
MSGVNDNWERSLEVLERFILDKKIVDHCRSTQEKAVHIAERIKPRVPVNVNLVRVGALLHDIGRARVHDITHGVVGGQILKEQGFPGAVILIVERHVLGGFTPSEAVIVGLPHRNFMPTSQEERIVCVADKLGHFGWNGIQEPNKWVAKLQERFAGLRKQYGGGEPFETSMRRAERYAKILASLAL